MERLNIALRAAVSLEHIDPMPHSADKDILRPIRERGDRIMAGVCVFLWLLSLSFVAIRGAWVPWLAFATPFFVVSLILVKFAPGTQFTRTSLAVLFMANSALLIHQSGGLIETHFIIFALMSFLLYYRDYVPVCAAAGFAAVHHYVFCRLEMAGYPVMIFPMNHSCSMVWVHVAYVVFEAAVLIFLGQIIRREALEAAAIASLGERIGATGVIDLNLSGTREMGASSDGMLRFLRATQQAVRQATEVAHGISSVSSEMSDSAARMIQAGRGQRTTSDSVIEIVEGISSTSQRIAEDCVQVGEIAHASASVIEEGRRAMEQCVDTIQQLTGSVESVSREIQELQTSSHRIEQIIQLVAELADRSNLLALNASIEAARAGDAGRGFAVVAHEVRELSDRTHRSLLQAQSVVDDVKSRTGRVLDSARQCMQQAAHGGTQVSDASATLGGVLRELPQVGDRASDVVDLARRHEKLTAQVADRMGEIAEAVTLNSADLDRIGRLSASLESMSGELARGVERFQFAAPAINDERSAPRPAADLAFSPA